MNFTILGLAAAALACAPGLNLSGDPAATPAPEQQGDQWSWHGRLAPGKTLEIRGVNGPITAEPGSGDEVVVTAEKHGRRSDPEEVRIEVVQDADGVTICSVYPGTRNRCGPDDEYHMSTHDNDVEVRFHAQVPPGVRLVGETVNGDVEATDLAGPVKASTVNGAVRLSTGAGDASGNTVNGSVTAAVRGQGQGPLRFRTVNGSVTVSLPKQLDADLEAETVNGSIQTDYPITVMGRLTPRHLSGRIGQGGRSLRLETVNGSIHIRSVD
ncbi:MAG TPA: DUF4097 family beta strand repeat-containing protein [Gemmatimonadales bacterium]|nr:DUF4097 family beta strand repeat-containing protein [Gemmatimonadales bacterium]